MERCSRGELTGSVYRTVAANRECASGSLPLCTRQSPPMASAGRRPTQLVGHVGLADSHQLAIRASLSLIATSSTTDNASMTRTHPAGTSPGIVRRWLCPLALLAAALPATAQEPAAPAAETALPFELPAPDATTVAFPDPAHTGPTVICFLGTECPLARLYAPQLAGLAAEFALQGVRFLGIDSNCHDSLEEVRQFVADHKLPFPVAKDYDNVVADRFQATRMSEVFI